MHIKQIFGRIVNGFIDTIFGTVESKVSKSAKKKSLNLGQADTNSMGRRDAAKLITVGTASLPLLELQIPLTQAANLAGAFLARVSATGESQLLGDLMEWAFNQYAPDFTFNFPGKDIKIHRSNTLTHKGYSDFPMSELQKVKENLPLLRKAANGEDILPPGHMPLEEVADPLAGGYPVNYEHVAECPYCLGEWAVNWFSMLPQYKKLFELFSENVSELKKIIPALTTDEIIQKATEHFKKLQEDGEILWYQRTGVRSFKRIKEYLKELAEYAKRVPVEELRRLFEEVLNNNLSSFKSWLTKLEISLEEINELPGLLERIRPYVQARDEALIKSIEDKLKKDLTGSLSGVKGRFIMLQNNPLGSIDDSPLIEDVINSNLEFSLNIKIKKITESKERARRFIRSIRELPAVIDDIPKYIDQISDMAVKELEKLISIDETLSNMRKKGKSNELMVHGEWIFIAIEEAINHAKNNPGEKLCIAFPSNHGRIPGLVKYYAGEIYLFSLIAEELYLSTGTEISFMYSFESSYERDELGNTSRKQQTFSNYLCEWAKSGEVGVNIVHPKLALGEGEESQLHLRYKKMQKEDTVSDTLESLLSEIVQ